MAKSRLKLFIFCFYICLLESFDNLLVPWCSNNWDLKCLYQHCALYNMNSHRLSERSQLGAHWLRNRKTKIKAQHINTLKLSKCMVDIGCSLEY